MPQEIHINALTVEEAEKAVYTCFQANVPVMLWGSPGMGKSMLGKHLALRIGIHLETLMLSQLDGAELRGIPVPNLQDNSCIWTRPDFLRTDPMILLLDEINTAATDTMPSAMQLVLDRRVGPHQLHPDSRILCTGNYTSDRASAKRMPTALMNRMVHIHIKFSLDSWQRWATRMHSSPEPLDIWPTYQEKGIHNAIIAFVRYQEKLVIEGFDPAMDEKAFLSPRSLQMMSQLIHVGMCRTTERALIAGTVGDGAAIVLSAFLELYQSLGNPREILNNPATHPLPDNDQTGVLYATTTGISQHVTPRDADAMICIADRLDQEFAVILVTLACDRDPQVAATPAVIEWRIKNQHMQS